MTVYAGSRAPQPARAVAVDYGGTITLEEIDHQLGDRPVDPEAAAALFELDRRGIILVLASNTLPGEPRWPALQQAGIHRLFRTVLLSHSLGVRKPEPLFYTLVTAAAGCPPGQVLFVGDNIRADVAGPLEHGMQAALVRPQGHLRPGETLPDGAALIRHVRDLPALLDAARGHRNDPDDPFASPGSTGPHA